MEVEIMGWCWFTKKLAHKRYKYAVCRVGKREEHLKSTRMAEALLDDPNCNFWPEVRQFNGNHKSAPTPVIDGVSGSDNITNIWYKNLSSSTIVLWLRFCYLTVTDRFWHYYLRSWTGSYNSCSSSICDQLFEIQQISWQIFIFRPYFFLARLYISNSQTLL